MSAKLFTSQGSRKYLTASELERFLAAAEAQERGEVRTLCLVLAYTGCRISEALALTAEHVDLSEKTLTFKTLKQRDRIAFRSVPVPEQIIDVLELVHSIRKHQRPGEDKATDEPLVTRKGTGKSAFLWNWKRTQAYNHVKQVLIEADITGLHASPKGLRHGFGVLAATKTRHPRMVQKWLGHRSLETTVIYMDVQGDEERELAERMWD